MLTMLRIESINYQAMIIILVLHFVDQVALIGHYREYNEAAA